MRRLVTVIFACLAGLLPSLSVPAAAVTAAAPVTYQLPHTNDVPATALDSVLLANGSLRTYWLANGLLYTQTRSALGVDGPTTTIAAATQVATSQSIVQARLNANGDLAVTYSCNEGASASVCVYIEYSNGNIFGPRKLNKSGVFEFETAWFGKDLQVFVGALGYGKNPFDAPRTWVSLVNINQYGSEEYNSWTQSWIDTSAEQFNASHLSISYSATGSVFAWESYESKGGVLGYVVRATVFGQYINGAVTSKVVANLGAERVRTLRASWLESADGVVPTLMWATDSTVSTASSSNTGWVVGASATLAGQALLVDSLVTDQGALQTVVKIRNVTTPVLSSFTLTDSRLPLVQRTLMANALSVTSLQSYQMVGGNPAVFVCTGVSVSLVNADTAAVIRTSALDGTCGQLELFDHAGAWVMLGIGTNYSLTQNSAHALKWIDNQSAVDLSPTNGTVIDQDFVSAKGVNVAAYVVRDWVDPAASLTTRDRLLVQAFDAKHPVGTLPTVMSDPQKTISQLHLVELANHKVVLIWQESQQNLFATQSSAVRAASFNPDTFEWSAIATASSPGTPTISLGQVAEGGSGTGQAGATVLMSASFSCPSCFTPLSGLLSFDATSNAFTVESAAVSEGSPSLAASQLGNGTTAWVFTPPSANFEPRVFVRSATGTWSGGLGLSANSLAPGTRLSIVPLASSADVGQQAAVLYNSASAGSGRGTLTAQRLETTNSGITLSPPLVVASDCVLEGGAVFDANAMLHAMLKTGDAVNGFEHKLLTISTANAVEITNSISNAAALEVAATADSLGRVALVWSDTGGVFTYQPNNSWETKSGMLGLVSHVTPAEVVADADDFGLAVSWYRALDLTTTPKVTSPLAVSVIGQGVPGEPQFEDLRFLDSTGFEARFSLKDYDSFTRLEYRATPGAAQSFAGGVSSDGRFSVTGIDVTKATSFDVRVVDNYGTSAQTAGAWKTWSWPAATVNKVQLNNQSQWKTATTALLAWDSLGFDSYTYEIEVTQAGKTTKFTSTAQYLTATRLDAKKPLTYRVRGSWNGVWGAWSDSGSLIAATGPTAPRSLVLKRVGTGLSVSWQNPAKIGNFPWLAYRVEMRVGTGAWKVAAKVAAKTWILKKPLKGKTYSFRVVLIAEIPSPASPIKTIKW